MTPFSLGFSRDDRPILIAALFQPGAGIKIEAINYFADTLLFAGVILALASA